MASDKNAKKKKKKLMALINLPKKNPNLVILLIIDRVESIRFG